MEEGERKYLIIAFSVITILTALSVLLANTGLLGETVRGSEFSKWGMVAVLAEIVAATVALFRFEFTSQKESKFWVTLEFPDTFPNFSNRINGEYEVIEDGNTTDAGKVFLAQDTKSGAYVWILPKKITSSHSQIFINLVDDNNQVWRKRFYPQVTVKMPPVPISSSIVSLKGGSQ